MTGELVIILGVISLFILGMHLARQSEKRDWNGGWCVNCGDPLEFFDMDSQGGRGYKCDQCNRTVWVSYPGVDRATGLPKPQEVRNCVVILEER